MTIRRTIINPKRYLSSSDSLTSNTYYFKPWIVIKIRPSCPPRFVKRQRSAPSNKHSLCTYLNESAISAQLFILAENKFVTFIVDRSNKNSSLANAFCERSTYIFPCNTEYGFPFGPLCQTCQVQISIKFHQGDAFHFQTISTRLPLGGWRVSLECSSHVRQYYSN